MRQVGFEHTIPVFERAKTVHALEGAATVIGILYSNWRNNYEEFIRLIGSHSLLSLSDIFLSVK
jgi:hypothetical protein